MRTLSFALPERKVAPGAGRLLASNSASAIGSGMTSPLLVVYLHTVRHLPLTLAASISAVGALVSLAGNPVGGYLADHIGARTTSFIGLAMAAAGTGSLAAAHTSPQAIACIALLGLGISVSLPAQQALLAHVVPAQALSRYFALTYMLLNIGFGVGGLSAALIAGTGHLGAFQTLYLLDAASFTLAALLIARVPVAGRTAQERPPTAWRALRLVTGDQPMRRIWLIALLLTTAGFTQLHTGFPAYAVSYTDASPRIISLAYLANTLTVVLVQLPLQRAIARRSPATVLILLCPCIAVPVLLVYLSAHTAAVGAALFICAAALLAVGEALYAASIPALVNTNAPPHLRGQYNAALMLAFTTANLLGPALSGFLLSHDHPTLWLMTFVIAAIAAIPLARSKPIMSIPPPASASSTP
ncbi:MFS transporter [Streptomyces sp. CA-251387]|uniref:MFS transporter n=1 Tax=Streptomyces sp. CA-251387 TaxID=3240064 RepID=UPI003D94ECEF